MSTKLPKYNRSSTIKFSMLIVLIGASQLMSVDTLLAAENYTSRDGGPSASELYSRNKFKPAEGLAFVRPVLTGVLYRAGFKGGDKARTGLSSTQRRQLCESGFSSVRYIDFGKHTKYTTTQCGAGRMTYSAGRSKRPSSIMKQIHSTIKNGNSGPLMVHCMWGVHSSGAISAMALVQFCGWSENRAKQYWDKARNGAGCSGGCDAWINAHFATFKYDPSLAISKTEQAAICPK